MSTSDFHSSALCAASIQNSTKWWGLLFLSKERCSVSMLAGKIRIGRKHLKAFWIQLSSCTQARWRCEQLTSTQPLVLKTFTNICWTKYGSVPTACTSSLGSDLDSSPVARFKADHFQFRPSAFWREGGDTYLALVCRRSHRYLIHASLQIPFCQ